jgi:bacterioferritin-associated ferredoxin
MIVCLCSGVSDGAIRAHARRGVSSLAELAEACGAGGDCGACCDALRGLLQECAAPSASAEHRQSAPTPPTRDPA